MCHVLPLYQKSMKNIENIRDTNMLERVETLKNSRTCRNIGKAICRFGHPVPPMHHTTILTPLADKTERDEQNFLIIKAKLEQF